MAVCLAILGLIIAGGLYFVIKGARNIQRSLASVHWPTTTGTVTSSETNATATRGDRRTAGSITYYTDTKVHYEVDGRGYSTDLVHFGQTFGSGDSSEAALKRMRYPPNKAVTVSYNPAAPEVAALRPGLHSDAFWLVIAGLAFALPALVGMFAVVKTFGPSAVAEDAAFQPAVQMSFQGPINSQQLPPELAARFKSDGNILAVGAGFMGVVACSLGLLAFSVGATRYWNGKASLDWPKVTGEIVAAPRTTGDEPDGAALESGTDTAWYARLVYHYTVNGAAHFSNHRRFAGVEGGNGPEVDRLLETYKLGAHVQVSYYPADPDIAVLEPGNTGDAYVLPIIGGVLLLFGSAIFLFIVPSVMKF